MRDSGDGAAMYDRPALMYHALRLEIGDDALFRFTRSLIQDNLHQTFVIDDLTAAAEEASGQDLDEFFDAWISQSEVPDLPTG